MTTENKLNLTDADWVKLQSYNTTISRNIHAMIPRDTGLSLHDVEGVVWDAMAKLIDNYREGDLSIVSYVYRYAEQYARRDLLRETWRARNHLRIDDLRGEDASGRECGRGDVPELTVDERSSQEMHDRIQLILDNATPEDRHIMQLILEGHTQEEIASEMGVSQRAVAKRLRKYAQLAI